MHNKSQKKKSHYVAPVAIAILMVGSVAVSLVTHTNIMGQQGSRMGESAYASDVSITPLEIQKELLSVYVSGSIIHILLPDSIISTVAPKPAQFTVMDNGVVNPVTHVAIKNGVLMLELQKTPSRKIMTVSYRDSIESRIFTKKSGYLRTFREKLVTPTDDISKKLITKCEDRIPNLVNQDTPRDDVIKLQWILSQDKYYKGKLKGVYDQALANAIAKFQMVHDEQLADTQFNKDDYGIWEEHTAKIARAEMCAMTEDVQ